MNIQQLYYFQSLAKYEHYQLAAEEQLTSASSISYAISSIESEIGLPLFQKSGRNIKITKYGTIFLEYVKTILETYELALKEMRNFSEEHLTTIKLSTIFSMSFNFLTPLITAFNNNSSKDKINFKIFYDGDTSAIINSVKNENAILGLCNYTEDPKIINYPLFKEEFVVIAPKGKYHFTNPLITFAPFENEYFVLYDEKYTMYKTINRIFESYHFKPKVLYNAPSDIFLASLVESGVGIAITTHSHMLSTYNVDIFKLKNTSSRTLSLIWRKGTQFSNSEMKFKKFIIENFDNIAGEYLKNSLEKS